MVRCIVQKCRSSSYVRVKGHGHQEQKKRKTAESSRLTMLGKATRALQAVCSRRVHCVAARGWRGDGSARWRFACGFVGSGTRGRRYAGGKTSACCLVLTEDVFMRTEQHSAAVDRSVKYCENCRLFCCSKHLQNFMLELPFLHSFRWTVLLDVHFLFHIITF